jgi:hypothetical protein
MLRLIPLAFLLLTSFFVKAQNITVKGIVRDTVDKNMSDRATVQFRIAEDSLKKFSRRHLIEEARLFSLT